MTQTRKLIAENLFLAAFAATVSFFIVQALH